MEKREKKEKKNKEEKPRKIPERETDRQTDRQENALTWADDDVFTGFFLRTVHTASDCASDCHLCLSHPWACNP